MSKKPKKPLMVDRPDPSVKSLEELKPITFDSMWKLLAEKVLLDNATMPTRGEVNLLGMHFAMIVRAVPSTNGAKTKDYENRKALFGLLTQAAPLINLIICDIELDPKRRLFGSTNEKGSELSALSKILRGINELEATPYFAEGNHKKPSPHMKWRDWAPVFERLFHMHLKGQSKAAGYRFVVAMAPYLLGDIPTFRRRIALEEASLCQAGRAQYLIDTGATEKPVCP